MQAYIARRMLAGLVTLLVIVTLAFIALRLTPGDPAEIWLADYATPDLVRLVRHELGLDKPLPTQFAIFLRRLSAGDLGRSYRSNRLVAQDLLEQYPYTLHLAAAGVLISILIGFPLGFLAGLHRNSIWDLIASASSVFWISTPGFWFALLLMILFSVYLGWFPLVGAGTPGNWGSMLYALILPAVALGARSAASVARMSRSAVIDVVGEDYIRTAKAKGLHTKRVVFRHVFPNALPAIISIIGIDTVTLLSGSVVVERIFGRPGVGALFVSAISSRDYPTVQGAVFFFAIAVIVINAFVDISYAFVDPRVRYD